METRMTNAAVYQPKTIKYLPQLQRVEPKVIDHSGLKIYKDCQKRYFFRVVLGLKPKETAHLLNWGTVYHKFREVLEKEYIRVEEKDKVGPFKAAIIAGLDYWERNIKEPAPESKYGFLTKDRFVLSCKEAYESWLKEKRLGQIKVLAVEQSFSIVLPDGTETCGRIDQIIKWAGKIWIRDFKTSTKPASIFENGINPNDQALRYIYAGTVLHGQPVFGAVFDVLYNVKSKGPEVYMKMTTRNEYQVKQWLEEQAHWTVKLSYSRDHESYGHNESGCGWCDFHHICKQSSEASQYNVIKTGYKFDPWDPLNHGD
jgi:hypothetical protein